MPTAGKPRRIVVCEAWTEAWSRALFYPLVNEVERVTGERLPVEYTPNQPHKDLPAVNWDVFVLIPRHLKWDDKRTLNLQNWVAGFGEGRLWQLNNSSSK